MTKKINQTIYQYDFCHFRSLLFELYKNISRIQR